MEEKLSPIRVIKARYLTFPKQARLSRFFAKVPALRLEAKDISSLNWISDVRYSDEQWLEAALGQWLREGRIGLSGIPSESGHRGYIRQSDNYPMRIDIDNNAIFIRDVWLTKILIEFYDNVDSNHYGLCDLVAQNSISPRASRREFAYLATKYFKKTSDADLDKAMAATLGLRRGCGVNQRTRKIL